MSIVANQGSNVFDHVAPIEDRNAERYHGMLIAVAATIALWGGIGTGIWGIVSLFT